MRKQEHNDGMLVRNRGTYCVNINISRNKIRAPGGRVAAAKHFSFEKCFAIIALLGALAHPVERDYGIVEVSSSSLLCSTKLTLF